MVSLSLTGTSASALRTGTATGSTRNGSRAASPGLRGRRQTADDARGGQGLPERLEPTAGRASACRSSHPCLPCCRTGRTAGWPRRGAAWSTPASPPPSQPARAGSSALASRGGIPCPRLKPGPSPAPSTRSPSSSAAIDSDRLLHDPLADELLAHLRRSGSRAHAPDSSRDPRPPLGRLQAGASVAGGHGVGRGSTGQAPRRPTPPPALSAADAAGPSRSPTPGPGPARSSPPGSASTRYRTPFDQPKPVPPSRRETLGQAEPPVTRPDSRATVIPRP